MLPARSTRREKNTTFGSLLALGIKTLDLPAPEARECRHCRQTFTAHYQIQPVCPTCVEENARLDAEHYRENIAAAWAQIYAGMGLEGVLCDMRLESFVAEDQPRASALVRAFVETYPACASLALIGKPGTGKTHLAVGVLHALGDKGYYGKYVHLPTAAGLLRQAEEWGKVAAKIFGPLGETPVLVLDDIGAEKMTDPLAEQIQITLNHRWNRDLPTILAANLDKGRAGLESWLGAANYSRVFGTGQIVEMNPVDQRLRGRRRPVPRVASGDPKIVCPLCKGVGWVIDAAVKVGQKERAMKCVGCDARGW